MKKEKESGENRQREGGGSQGKEDCSVREEREGKEKYMREQRRLGVWGRGGGEEGQSDAKGKETREKKIAAEEKEVNVWL